MAKGEENEAPITQAIPAVKHALIMYFSSKTKTFAADFKNRKTLREEALVEANKAINEITGKDLITDVYFTNFTVQ